MLVVARCRACSGRRMRNPVLLPAGSSIPFLVGFAITALYRLSQAGTPELAAFYGYALAQISIGGVLAGISMASVFPVEAVLALGFAVVGLPAFQQFRDGRRGTSSTANPR